MGEAAPGVAGSAQAGPFWKGVAVAAVLVAGSFAALEGTDRVRRWSAEDRVLDAQRAAEDAARRAKHQAQVKEARAAAARRQRVAQIRATNLEHPERFRAFEGQDFVRVLSSSPAEKLRGLQALVWTKHDVSDPETGVVWEHRYTVSMLPFTEPGSAVAFHFETIDAEHLALLGSEEEQADLQAHPELMPIARRQQAEIDASFRWIEEVGSRPPVQVGDIVVVRDSDPRAALRGRRGRVIHIDELRFDHEEGVMRVADRECDVQLEGTGSVLPIRVSVLNLEHAPR